MKNVRIAILFLFLYQVSVAQQLPNDNQYLINPCSLSPAFAGANENIEASAGVRQAWKGITGAPKKMMFSVNGSMLENSMGLALSFQSEQIGSFEHFYANIAYAYHMELGDGKLSLGVGAEIYKQQLEVSKVTSTLVDPIFADAEILKGMAFNANAGVVFTYGGLTVGVAAPRLMGPSISYPSGDEINVYTLNPEFLGHASYFHEFNDDFSVEPIVVVRQSTTAGMFFDVAARIRYRTHIWLAPAVKSGGFAVNVGAALNSRMLMNYTYEFGSSDLYALSNGSHEISMAFLINRGDNNKNKLFPPDAGQDNILKKKLENLEKHQMKVKEELENKVEELNNRIDSLKTAQPAPKPEEEKKDDEEEGYNFNPTPTMMNNIVFAKNSADLLPSSGTALMRLSVLMKRDPKIKIKIVGHTDNQGSDRYNLKLSEDRAKAIKEFLVQKRGVKADRIITQGKGETVPIASNDTDEGRRKNRRIEIYFGRPKK